MIEPNSTINKPIINFLFIVFPWKNSINKANNGAIVPNTVAFTMLFGIKEIAE